jgi:hypothetical protein
MKKFYTALLGLFFSFGLMFAPMAVNATPVDVSALGTAVDFSSATATILVVAGLLITVYIAIKSVKFVINMVRGG